MASVKKISAIFWHAARFGAVLGIGVFGVLAFAQNAFAVEQAGLSISPLTFELTGDKGDTITNELRVFNPTPNRFSVAMDTEDFTATGELGAVIVESHEDTSYSLKKWVSFDPPTFSLDPGEKQFVRFTIIVPDDAEPGGHYGSILATIKAAEGNTGGSGVSARVGSLVLLSVSGEIKEELLVEEFKAPNFQEKGPIPFNVRFANKGTVHVRPIGFIQIANLFGRKVEDLQFPQKNLIPGAKRFLEFAWSPKGFTAGRYTASLVGNYGQNNTPVSAVTVFWVVPWKQLAVWGVTFLVVLGVLVKMRKRFGLAFGILFKGQKV